MKKFSVQAVALDLDGTLLDTLPDIAEAANRMLDDLGRERTDLATVRSYIGDGIPRLTKRLLAGSRDGEPDSALFERALPLFQRHYRDTFTLTSRPFPGVLDGLGCMRALGLRLACVTNKAIAFSAPLLEATGLTGYLDLVIGGDSLPSKKPDPGPLLHVAQQFSVSPAAPAGDRRLRQRQPRRPRGRLPGVPGALRLHRRKGCTRAGRRCYSYRPRRGLLVDPTYPVVNAVPTGTLKWLVAGSWRPWRRLPVT